MCFVDDGTRALDWVASYRERVDRLPVLSQVQPGEVRAQLPRSAPEQGLSLESLLEDMDRVILPGVTHWQSPRFFAYFSTTGSEPGVIGELLTAALNNVGILWRTSPALQELEETVLAWLAELIGLPAGWHGHLEEGASFSTLAALAAAREAKPGARVVVCSEHAHSSVDKACRLLELELRKTPADEAFRLRPELLDLTDACAVVATVGTTSSTSVDPVPAIADACERAGVWLHVDAAYAGSAMVCPEFRWAFDGIERVDSLVVNPHKWLLTPQGCSAFWTRRPEALREAFGLVPEYLRTPDEVVSFSEYSPELGRPFRALKLWAVLRHYGAEGLRARIRAGVGLAQDVRGTRARRAGLGAVRAASVLGRVLPPRRERRRERGADGARERDGRDLHLAHEAERPLRDAHGVRQRAHDDRRRAARLGRAARRAAAPA